jgi:hypothetical protein
MKPTAKERNKDKLLKYLGNPENEFLTREKLSTEVLGYKTGEGIYKTLSPADLEAIDAEALEMRRSKYSRRMAEVDKGVLLAASAGDAKAAKLAYQRFEGWVEKTKTENEHIVRPMVIIHARGDRSGKPKS